MNTNSTTEDRLLNNIINSPADDHPRLAYAQWLEESSAGAPRDHWYTKSLDHAELIRAEIAIARNEDPKTGKALSPTFKRFLEERAAILHDFHFDRFDPEIREIFLKEGTGRIRFDRGFISDLDLSNTGATRLPAALTICNRLDISGSKITTLPPAFKNGGITILKGSWVTSLPQDMEARGEIVFAVGQISRATAHTIYCMPGLSRRAKATALESGGHEPLGRAVERQTDIGRS
jgi:uncharacterized protein (TIGR02996 family)